MSADALSCVEGCIEMGAQIHTGDDFIIQGFGHKPLKKANLIDVGNSGTTLRILTGIAALADQRISFDGDNSIRQRPMVALFDALKNLGVTIDSSNDRCPFSVKGPLKGGKTNIDGISSQFLTALLIAAPVTKNDTEITVENLHEKPYVEMTLSWLRDQGIKFENKGLEWFKIPGRQRYKPFKALIPADFSTATFPLCAAAITKSDLTLKGLNFEDSQGDKAVFDHLRNMGLELDYGDEEVHIKNKDLKGIDIDMDATPDALPALAVVGCFAKGTTRLLNVEQARYKECDRIASIAKELKKMGARIEEQKDGLIIHESKLKGSVNLHGYHDHRMVMALSLAAMGAEGESVIDTAESVKITYPSFAEDFREIGADIEQISG